MNIRDILDKVSLDNKVTDNILNTTIPGYGKISKAIKFLNKLKNIILSVIVVAAIIVFVMFTKIDSHAEMVMNQYTTLNKKVTDSKQNYNKPVKFITVRDNGTTSVEIVYSSTVKNQFLDSYNDVVSDGILSQGGSSLYIDDASEVSQMTRSQFLSALSNSSYDQKSIALAYDTLHEVFDGDMNAVIAFIGNFMGEGDIGLVQGGMTLKNWNGDGKDVITGYEHGVNRTYVRSATNIKVLRNHLNTVGENNHIGVGIAQWTYHSRLKKLLDLYDDYTSGAVANSEQFISGIEKAEREYLKNDLKSYKDSIIKYAQGKTTTTVNGRSRAMDSWRSGTAPGSMEAYVIAAVNVYEKPAERASNIQKRIVFAQNIYKTLKDYMENR